MRQEFVPGSGPESNKPPVDARMMELQQRIDIAQRTIDRGGDISLARERLTVAKDEMARILSGADEEEIDSALGGLNFPNAA